MNMSFWDWSAAAVVAGSDEGMNIENLPFREFRKAYNQDEDWMAFGLRMARIIRDTPCGDVVCNLGRDCPTYEACAAPFKE